MPSFRVPLLALFVTMTLIVITAQSLLAQKSDANNVIAMLNSAQAKMDAKEWTQAASILEEVVKLNPVNGDYWNQLADSLYQAKDYRKAIAAGEKALEFGASLPSSYMIYNIARCYARLGENDQALKWLEKAFANGYRHLREAQSDPVFQPLRNNSRFLDVVGLPDTVRLSRDDGWRCDLQLLAREVKRKGYAPFRKVSAEDFDASVKSLYD